jgi:hypothetical protein
MSAYAFTSLTDAPRCLDGEALCIPPARLRSAPTQRRWRPCASEGIVAFRSQAAAECFDTAAVLRAYREPLEGETWQLPRESEERLLAQVEAIVMLGSDALAAVARRAIDPDLPDPGRVFAALLTLGCIEGSHWVSAVTEIFVTAVVRDATEAEAAIEALSLAPNLELRLPLIALVHDTRPLIRAAALRVLGFRGDLPEPVWVDALRDGDRRVVLAALCSPLGSYDALACATALEPHLAVDSERIVSAALRAGTSRRLALAHECATQIVRSGDPTWANAAICLATFGLSGDAKRLTYLLDSAPWLIGVSAAARSGLGALLPPLFGLLARRGIDATQTAAVGLALTTVTGLPFASLDRPSDAHGLWAGRRADFEPSVRYRHGQRLDLTVMLRSLIDPMGSRRLRQSIYAEMQVARGGVLPRFDSCDFVATQIRCIHCIATWLGAAAERSEPLTTLV